MRTRLVAGAAAAFGLVLLARAGALGARQAPCPSLPTPALVSEVPSDVCIPPGLTGTAVEQFDDYSWRTFTALVWPADPGRRGTAARTRPLSTPGARVFETFKTLNEVFHPDGSAPEPMFNRYDGKNGNPCGVTQGFGDLTIGSHSGIDDIGQAGIGELDGPLVAQNGRYVRMVTFFNQTMFDFMVSRRLYLRENLPAVPSPRPDRPVLEFPVGSVAVKTAWVDVSGFPPALIKRLYTRPVFLKSATGSGCKVTTMGLIGMHVAQKTDSRPQWIWSSFEQRDTVPPKWPDWPGAYLLNDDKGTAMPAKNPLALVPLAPEPATPFNVFRHRDAPILTPTELTSFAYRRLLEGTPWQHYRLVVTQWPRLEGDQAQPIPANVDGTIANTFPGAGAFSAFTNVTMETFDQHAVQLGCMSCHNRARMGTDFMWTVLDHAYPKRLAPAGAKPN